MRRRVVLLRVLGIAALAALPWLGVQTAEAAAVRAGTAGGALPGWPAAGRIDFEVRRGEGGMKLGEAHHRWSHDGSRYRMETVLETTGLAAMLVDFRYTQRSEGRISARGLVPEQFRVEQAGRAPESARFDWAAGTVAIERKGNVTEAPIRAGDQDLLSVWHLLAAAEGRAVPDEVNLVTNRRISAASVAMLERETVRLPMGTFPMQRYRVQAKSGKLTVDLWVSEAHEWVPLRIMITDDKGMVLDQRALSFDTGAAASKN